MKYRIFHLGDESIMIGLIKERLSKEGHFVIYCKLEKNEFLRVSEVLKREDIYIKRLVGNFILFYPAWRSDATVEEITEMAKKNMPSLFEDLDN